MRITIIIRILLLLFFPACGFSSDNAAIYGNIPSDDYVTGRFDPAKHELFISLADLGIPTNNRPHRLRREAAEALKELYAAFRKDNPKAPFWVQSSARSFEDQKYIWEGKWTGKTEVNGRDLSRTIPDHLKRAIEILKFSSMPGASRHHWGTDFDLNVLSNDYFEKGEGKQLYLWMSRNARRYGFCQPYTRGRNAGHGEEKWHWSYLPLARIFLARWNSFYERDPRFFKQRVLFRGSATAGGMASDYVNSVDARCR